MKRCCRFFSLIELITAMAIFSVLMVVMMKFFQEAQQAWTLSNQRAMVYDNARVAMDLITRDLQAAYYKKDVTPFWHKGKTTFATWSEYSNESLAFIAATPMPQEHSTTPFNEVIYQLYYTDVTNSNAGWLMRSVTGNKSDATTPNTKHNYPSNFGVSKDTAADAFTLDGASNEAFEKVIPYVTNLNFECFKADGSVISTSDSAPTDFPFIVMVELTLLDKDSWNKWLALGATPNQAVDDSDTDPARSFRLERERTFTKMIFMGERGQSL